MKNKLMKYATMYLMDLKEDMGYTFSEMSYNDFLKFMKVTFKYIVIEQDNRKDAILNIYMDGEIDSTFSVNISR